MTLILAFRNGDHGTNASYQQLNRTYRDFLPEQAHMGDRFAVNVTNNMNIGSASLKAIIGSAKDIRTPSKKNFAFIVWNGLMNLKSH